eukprot:1451139-Amphidinium_carterae.1
MQLCHDAAEFDPCAVAVDAAGKPETEVGGVELDDADVHEGRKRKSEGKDESKKQEQSSSSILKSVASMLCDEVAVRLWIGFCSLISPVESWFHRGMQAARMPSQMCDWHIDLVEGSLYRSVLGLFDHFLSESFAVD